MASSKLYNIENFDPKPDEELVCSICHGIYQEPTECPCGHVFCNSCIISWLRVRRNCPICRKFVAIEDLKPVAPLIRNMIMKLTMICPHQINGCFIKITLDTYSKHVKECPWEIIKCVNFSCMVKGLRKEIQLHQVNECANRLVQCQKGCDLLIPLEKVESHSCLEELKLAHAALKKRAETAEEKLLIASEGKRDSNFRLNLNEPTTSSNAAANTEVEDRNVFREFNNSVQRFREAFTRAFQSSPNRHDSFEDSINSNDSWNLSLLLSDERSVFSEYDSDSIRSDLNSSILNDDSLLSDNESNSNVGSINFQGSVVSRNNESTIPLLPDLGLDNVNATLGPDHFSSQEDSDYISNSNSNFVASSPIVDLDETPSEELSDRDGSPDLELNYSPSPRNSDESSVEEGNSSIMLSSDEGSIRTRSFSDTDSVSSCSSSEIVFRKRRRSSFSCEDSDLSGDSSKRRYVDKTTDDSSILDSDHSVSSLSEVKGPVTRSKSSNSTSESSSSEESYFLRSRVPLARPTSLKQLKTKRRE